MQTVIRRPRHIAVIMDGNGRWAQNRYLPRVAGYKQGVEATQLLVRACVQADIPALTLFAFSSENWSRPHHEVSFLMDLLLSSLRREIGKLHDNNIRLKVIGERSRLNAALQREISQAEDTTQYNSGLKLQVAVNYGGQWDLVSAARALAQKVSQGLMQADDIQLEDFEAELALKDLPPPDLLIRTGGERRISNFLLWHLAYAELFFSDLLWPDFKLSDFNAALDFYASRERRFGNVPQQAVYA